MACVCAANPSANPQFGKVLSVSKLLLLSILIMMVVIPVQFSKARNPGVGLRRSLAGFFFYSVFYWLAVVVIYFTLIVGRSPAELLSKTVHD